jgi:tetratricopeptide (TPR) repeat protein
VGALAVNRKLGIVSWLRGMSALVPDPVAGLRSRQEAVAAEKAGDFLNAGLHYEKLSLWDKALECYEKAEEYHLAGQLCLRLGHKEVAAEWFLLSNEKLRAAQLYRELGKRRKAAEAYVKAGASLEAAAEFLEAEARQGGRDSRAGGNLVRAIEAHERAGLREGGRLSEATGDGARKPREPLSGGGANSRSRGSATAPEDCSRKRETGQALDLYERAARFVSRRSSRKARDAPEGGGALRKSGAVEKAAELYERRGCARGGEPRGDARLSAGDAAPRPRRS